MKRLFALPLLLVGSLLCAAPLAPAQTNTYQPIIKPNTIITGSGPTGPAFNEDFGIDWHLGTFNVSPVWLPGFQIDPFGNVTAGSITGTSLNGPVTGNIANLNQLPAQLPGTIVGVGINASGQTSPIALVRNTLYVSDFGAKCDGSTDDTTAFQAVATKANLTGSVQISVPAFGACKLSGTVTFTANFISVMGSGKSASQIIQTTDGIDTFVWSSTTPTTAQIFGGSIQNIWLRRTAVTTGGVGLKLVRANGFTAISTDIRDFYSQVEIDGGSIIHFLDSDMTAGTYFAGIVAGSNLIRFAAAPLASGYEWPSEVFVNSFNWKAYTNNYVSTAVLIEGGDGYTFTGGHLGFAQTQILFKPIQNNVPILSISFNGVIVDGNNSAPTGISIPALTTTGGSITDIIYNGGTVEDVTANGIDIREPTAEFAINSATIQNIGGWAGYNFASGKFTVNGVTLKNIGATVSSTGAFYTGTLNRVQIVNSGFNNVTGTCITTPTSVGSTPSIHYSANMYDGSCTSPRGESLNYSVNAVGQSGNVQGTLVGGAYSQAYGNNGIAWGNASTSNSYMGAAWGDSTTASSYFAWSRGYNADDRGRYGSDNFSSGDISAHADSQISTMTLHGTGATASNIRVTADGNSARTGGNGSNCANMPINSSAALNITLMAIDKTTNTKNYTASWGFGSAAPHLLTIAGTLSTTLLDGVTTSIAPDNNRSNGTITGATSFVAADTTNGCINLAFTPPTSNTDTWDVTARVETVEVL